MQSSEKLQNGQEASLNSAQAYSMKRSARCSKRRLIEEAEGRPNPHLDNERRRYYRITKLGRKIVQAEAARRSNW